MRASTVTGILGEPALAAMIQQDIGANPEDPHANAHGTFSFDISNGACGVLAALQIVDGFMKSRAIDCALVVASDADPGHGMSETLSVLAGWGGTVVRTGPTTTTASSPFTGPTSLPKTNASARQSASSMDAMCFASR